MFDTKKLSHDSKDNNNSLISSILGASAGAFVYAKSTINEERDVDRARRLVAGTDQEENFKKIIDNSRMRGEHPSIGKEAKAYVQRILRDHGEQPRSKGFPIINGVAVGAVVFGVSRLTEKVFNKNR